MFKEELVAVCQQKAQERKANEYIAENKRKRKQMKCKKAVYGIVVAAFFIAALAIVGKNDLESEGIVLAKESEISCENSEHSIIDGVVFYKDVIICDDNYRRRYKEKQYEEGTEITVEYDDNGTENPNDDIVFDVYKR